MTVPAVPAPDLSSASTREEMLDRLPATLEYRGEFGTELVCFLPLVFGLHRRGWLGRRTVSSYAGMEPFYAFLPPDRFAPHDRARNYVPSGQRPQYLFNRSEHRTHRHPLESWPDYRTMYRDGPLRFNKPLLVVQNKFSSEWNLGAVNFMSADELDRLFERFKRHYQIVYFRERKAQRPEGYSADHNRPLAFDDQAVLQRHPEVIRFDDLLAATPGAHYNTLKLHLFAHCHFFIGSQGGANYLSALFSDSLMLILHRVGRELHHSYTHGFFRYISDPPPDLYLARNSEQFERLLEALVPVLPAAGPAPSRPAVPAAWASCHASLQRDPHHVIARPDVF